MQAQILGEVGESYVASCLSSAGMKVEKGYSCDLVADGARIEVKAARFKRYDSRHYRGYQFCLHRDGRNGVQADVVILLCWYDLHYDPIAFVIPADELGDLKKVTITGDPRLYTGRWRDWLCKWEVIADYVTGA
jgi:hypothetical protein